MTICITGANGRLGREVLSLIPNAIRLVRHHCEEHLTVSSFQSSVSRTEQGLGLPSRQTGGHSPTGESNRHPSNLKNEITVDFSNEKELKKALSDCDILIHLAGSRKFYDAKALHEANAGLTKKLMDALPKNAKVIYASSISVFGKKLSGAVDEKTPVNPDTPYAKTKYEGEQMVMARKNSIALRIGPIYGLQYEDYTRFLRMIKKGRLVIFGNGKNRIPFVHAEDVAKAIKSAINAKPGVYILTGKSESQEKIYQIAADALKVHPPKTQIPIKVALAFASLMEKYASLTGKKPFITKEHVKILSSDRVFNCEKAERELGFNPRPIAQGIKEIVKNMGQAS